MGGVLGVPTDVEGQTGGDRRGSRLPAPDPSLGATPRVSAALSRRLGRMGRRVWSDDVRPLPDGEVTPTLVDTGRPAQTLCPVPGAGDPCDCPTRYRLAQCGGRRTVRAVHTGTGTLRVVFRLGRRGRVDGDYWGSTVGPVRVRGVGRGVRRCQPSPERGGVQSPVVGGDSQDTGGPPPVGIRGCEGRRHGRIRSTPGTSTRSEV